MQGHGPRLSQNELKLLAKIVADYREAGLEAPDVKQVQQQAAKNQSSVPQLISLAAANGDLVHLQGDSYVHQEVDQACRDKLRGPLRRQEWTDGQPDP